MGLLPALHYCGSCQDEQTYGVESHLGVHTRPEQDPGGAGLPRLWIMSTSDSPDWLCSLPFLTSRGHLVFLDPRLAGWLGDEYKKETRVLWVMILWL